MSTKYATCTSNWYYFLSTLRLILPARGSRPDNFLIYLYKQKCVLEKRQRSVRLIWSAEKVKCEANRSNNWAKLTKYTSCTSSRQYFLKPPEFLPARGTRQQKFHLRDLSNQQHYDKGIIVTILFISFVYLCKCRSQRLQC